MNITEYIEKTKHIQPPFYKAEYDILLQIQDEIEHSGDKIPTKEIGGFWSGYTKVCPKCDKKLQQIVSFSGYAERKAKGRFSEINCYVYYCKECDYKITEEE